MKRGENFQNENSAVIEIQILNINSSRDGSAHRLRIRKMLIDF
jgi:hypothetical protein